MRDEAFWGEMKINTYKCLSKFITTQYFEQNIRVLKSTYYSYNYHRL